MIAARRARALDETKLLVIERAGRFFDTTMDGLPSLLGPEDVLVVNDAATLPASLKGRDARGAPIELRLLGELDGAWRAFVLGDGDWHTPTEFRPNARIAVGDVLSFDGLTARVAQRESDRLVRVRFDGDLYRTLYSVGRPVQYAHLEHELDLWTVQTAYATRPWAVEMPSAGRPLQWKHLLALRARGVKVCALTHAAGLSSSGEAALDAKLPLRERYDIPLETARAVQQARGRVVAVGTSVVRALESAASDDGSVRPGEGSTELVLSPRHRPKVVDGLLSGLHDETASHFSLLGAFVSTALLRDAYAHADRAGYASHELGDVCLIY